MLAAESTEVAPSPEEVNQLHRSIKKFKWGPADLDTDQTDSMLADDANVEHAAPMDDCWTTLTFADKVRQQSKKPPCIRARMR